VNTPLHERHRFNLARFDLVSIRLAVYCAETGSLSAAARRSHMSLSRASHRLSALESSVGVQLFDRHCHGLRTTSAGEVFVSHGRMLMLVMERLCDGLTYVQR